MSVEFRVLDRTEHPLTLGYTIRFALGCVVYETRLVSSSHAIYVEFSVEGVNIAASSVFGNLTTRLMRELKAHLNAISPQRNSLSGFTSRVKHHLAEVF